MKTAILTFLAISLFALSTKAQGNWSSWVTVYQDDAYPEPHKVEVSFKMGAHCLNYSYYRTNSNFNIKYGTVNFYYDYLDCDNKTQSDHVTVNLDKPGIDFSATGSWFIGSKVVTQFRDVTFYQPAPPKTNTDVSSGSLSGNNQTTFRENTSDYTKNKTNDNSNLTQTQQQTQQYINNAQNSSQDAIQQAAALNAARINARRQNGSTTEQQEQIEQQEEEQSQSNTNTITSGITQIAGALSDYFNSKAQRQQQEENERENARLEREQRQEERKEAQREEDLATIMDYYNNGLAAYKNNKFAEAIVDFDQCVNLDPQVTLIPYNTYIDIIYHRGMAKHNLTHYADAIVDYSEVIRRNPTYIDAYLNRGLIKYSLRQYTDAIVDLDQCIRLNPKADVAYYWRGIVKHLLSQYAEAIADFDVCIRLSPQNQDAYYNRGTLKYELAQYAEAIPDFTECIRLNPKNQDAYYWRGASKSGLAQHTEAIIDFDECIRLNPQNQDAYHQKGISEVMLFQHQKAIEDFTKAIEISPAANWGFYYSRTYEYAAIGDYQYGINDCDYIITHQNSVDAKFISFIYFKRADYEYRLHQFRKAINDCDSAITLDPQNTDAYYLRGKTSLQKLNVKTAAINDLNKVLTMDTSKKSDSFIFSSFYLGHPAIALQIMKDKFSVTGSNFDTANKCYNMACLLSLMNKRIEANMYLKKAIDAGISKKYAFDDDDLTNLKNTPEFIKLITKNLNGKTLHKTY